MSSWDPKNRAISRRSCQVICRFSSTTRTRIDRGTLLADIWRMRAALKHRDRGREISFGGCDFILGKFIKATSYHFPALESLFICFPHDHEPELPTTFLRGPDQSDLRLRRLRLYGGSVASISELLLSPIALTDLTLSVTSTHAAVFDPSQGSFLLACLRGMQCLRSLDLATGFDFRKTCRPSIQLPKILSHY
jgi:hypothetical protein